MNTIGVNQVIATEHVLPTRGLNLPTDSSSIELSWRSD